jgi:DNA-binding response OmpR family regulator
MENNSLLIVDDDQDLSKLLASELSNAGFNVVLSTGAADANLKLANQSFRCVILDLKIGSRTGLEIAQQLRAGKSATAINKDTPIILMSGYLNTEVVEKLRPLVQKILAKPFTPIDLIEKINELLGLGPKIAKMGENFYPSVADDVENKEFRVFLHDFSSKLMVMNLLVHQLKTPGASTLEIAGKLEGNLKKIETMVQIVRFAIKNND